MAMGLKRSTCIAVATVAVIAGLAAAEPTAYAATSVSATPSVVAPAVIAVAHGVVQPAEEYLLGEARTCPLSIMWVTPVQTSKASISA